MSATLGTQFNGSNKIFVLRFNKKKTRKIVNETFYFHLLWPFVSVSDRRYAERENAPVLNRLKRKRSMFTIRFNFSMFRKISMSFCFCISFRINPKFLVVISNWARRRFLKKHRSIYLFFSLKFNWKKRTVELDDKFRLTVEVRWLKSWRVEVQRRTTNYFLKLILRRVLSPETKRRNNSSFSSSFFQDEQLSIDWLKGRAVRWHLTS